MLADQGRTQFRTAETEKYPHVTYFFNGGYEPPYPGEERCLIPSQRVATYDLAPEMSAPGSPRRSAARSRPDSHDFILCNYANADMVGHTGVLPAVIKRGGDGGRLPRRGCWRVRNRPAASVLITADHGNCEMMIDPITGGVHTAHTTNPVPLVAFGTRAQALRGGGSLRDVAPTVLRLLGIEPPAEMTGRDLRETIDERSCGSLCDRRRTLWPLPARCRAAQVGHAARASPYRDIHKGHTVTAIFGQFGGGGRAIRHRAAQRQLLRHPLRHPHRKRGPDRTRVLSRETSSG